MKLKNIICGYFCQLIDITKKENGNKITQSLILKENDEYLFLLFLYFHNNIQFFNILFYTGIIICEVVHFYVNLASIFFASLSCERRCERLKYKA